MPKKIYLIIIICASLATHFLFFGQPRETVFDEVHFGKFISGYFTHEYFFDIHPPLGKLLISGMGYATSFKPGFSFAEIGQQFPDRGYLWLRLLPTLAGVLLPIIIFFLILELGLSPLAAFAGGLMIAFENALLVQSRFILLDPFLLLFGFAALLFYFKYKNSSTTTHLFLSGLFAALTVSVKWTGLTFLAIIGILYLINWIKSENKAPTSKLVGIKRNSSEAEYPPSLAFGELRKGYSPLTPSSDQQVGRYSAKENKIKNLASGLVFLVVIPFGIYFLIFTSHFLLLNKSGPGDAFMTQEFRKTLTGSTDSTNADIKSLNIFQKFRELNVQMYKSNATLTASHPYSSKWYTWPFMIRPIYYWNNSANGQQSRIYLLGNPVIWWASTVAMLYLLIGVFYGLYRGVRPKLLPVLLTGTYLLNILPFIGISRAMFLYHYFIGSILAIIALVYLIDRLENKKRAFVALLVASVAMFIFFAPLTYGLPLTEKAYHLRNWLPSWI